MLLIFFLIIANLLCAQENNYNIHITTIGDKLFPIVYVHIDATGDLNQYQGYIIADFGKINHDQLTQKNILNYISGIVEYERLTVLGIATMHNMDLDFSMQTSSIKKIVSFYIDATEIFISNSNLPFILNNIHYFNYKPLRNNSIICIGPGEIEIKALLNYQPSYLYFNFLYSFEYLDIVFHHDRFFFKISSNEDEFIEYDDKFIINVFNKFSQLLDVELLNLHGQRITFRYLLHDKIKRFNHCLMVASKQTSIADSENKDADSNCEGRSPSSSSQGMTDIELTPCPAIASSQEAIKQDLIKDLDGFGLELLFAQADIDNHVQSLFLEEQVSMIDAKNQEETDNDESKSLSTQSSHGMTDIEFTPCSAIASSQEAIKQDLIKDLDDFCLELLFAQADIDNQIIHDSSKDGKLINSHVQFVQTKILNNKNSSSNFSSKESKANSFFENILAKIKHICCNIYFLGLSVIFTGCIFLIF